MSVPDEGYSRNVSCTLNLISTFLLQKDDSDADSGNEEPGGAFDFYTNEEEYRARKIKSPNHKTDKLAERITALTTPREPGSVPEGLVDSMPPEGKSYCISYTQRTQEVYLKVIISINALTTLREQGRT